MICQQGQAGSVILSVSKDLSAESIGSVSKDKSGQLYGRSARTSRASYMIGQQGQTRSVM